MKTTKPHDISKPVIVKISPGIVIFGNFEPVNVGIDSLGSKLINFVTPELKKTAGIFHKYAGGKNISVMG